jgi:WD40 repeat protein
MALSGGEDTTVRIWDLTAGREILALRGHEAPVTAIGFSAHGCAVSGSRDGTVRFWDLAAQGELLSLGILDDGDWLAITPDGYFDGSPWVADLVDVRAGGRVLPVREYRPSLRNPDVIRRVLLGVNGATPADPGLTGLP